MGADGDADAEGDNEEGMCEADEYYGPSGSQSKGPGPNEDSGDGSGGSGAAPMANMGGTVALSIVEETFTYSLLSRIPNIHGILRQQNNHRDVKNRDRGKRWAFVPFILLVKDV